MAEKMNDLEQGRTLSNEANALKQLTLQKQKSKREKINQDMIEGVLKNLDCKIQQQE